MRPTPSTPTSATGADGHGQSGLERAVLSAVRTLLVDDTVVLDDDFFGAGGNSLLAGRLVAQLHAMLGVTVPLHEIVGNSTVREIAALADRDFARGSWLAHQEPRLLAVRNEGSLPPLVLLARDGATSLVLQHFLKQLDREHPLWVLLRPMPPLGHQVPDLVADGAAVAGVLLEHFPSDPVHLVGHSASGIVTVEAARALGERRGATILLDTVPPSFWSSTRLRPLANAVRVLLARWRLRSHDRTDDADDGDSAARSATARALRMYQDSLASAQTVMRPFDFELTVLTSEATRDDVGAADLGWGRWTSRTCLVEMPGDHLSLILQPDVADTAKAIGAVLAGWSQRAGG